MLLLWPVFWISRLVQRMRRFLVFHSYSVSFAVSVLLSCLNILVYSYGCQNLKAFLGPGKLHHGHVPVFPSHFFHGPALSNKSITLTRVSSRDPAILDAYLHSHVLHNSLSAEILPAVHVIWCDTGPFTFAHYLSVVAAFKAISPSVLNLHLIREPDIDPDGYFQFLPDLLRDLPPLVTRTLQFKYACYGSPEEKIIAYMQVMGALGGIIINGRTLVAPSSLLAGMMSSKLSIVTQEDRKLEPVILMAQKNVLRNIPTEDSLYNFLKSYFTKYQECKNVRSFSFLANHTCVFIHEDIYPVMIFNGSSDFDHLARWIGYGLSMKLVSVPAISAVVPNIIHYVWLGQRKLDFFAYLSVMSSLYVFRAEVVYVHGDYKPQGALWAAVEKNPRVKFIHRDLPNAVFGEPIKKFLSHSSDYLRGEILLRYGGVYADWDVIFLQELPFELRQHNTTVGVDWPETGAFPDVFNLGVLVSAPNAPFLRYFLESYRWYLDRHWSYNAIHMPYKVYEKQPRSLNVFRHLQVS